MPETERVHRTFWCINEDLSVKKAEGYSCAPSNDAWWFPSLGWSGWENSSAFDRKEDALRHAIRGLNTLIDNKKKLLFTLEEELDKCRRLRPLE